MRMEEMNPATVASFTSSGFTSPTVEFDIGKERERDVGLSRSSSRGIEYLLGVLGGGWKGGVGGDWFMGGGGHGCACGTEPFRLCGGA